MTELITDTIITAISAFLLSYWFRCACLLILAARITRSTAPGFRFGDARSMLREHLIVDLEHLCAIAVENGLSFPQVQELLHESAVTNLDRVRFSLERDYRVLVYLLPREYEPLDKAGLERRLLAFNYRLLGLWYALSRRFSTPNASHVLEEMSWVVGHLAGSLPAIR